MSNSNVGLYLKLSDNTSPKYAGKYELYLRFIDPVKNEYTHLAHVSEATADAIIAAGAAEWWEGKKRLPLTAEDRVKKLEAENSQLQEMIKKLEGLVGAMFKSQRNLEEQKILQGKKNAEIKEGSYDL